MVAISVIDNKVVGSATREGCGYNAIFRYQWRTHTNALPMHVIEIINRITDNRLWGWTFSPHKNMDYTRPNWYEDQTLILTFDNQDDLVQAKLEIAHLL